MYRSIFFLAFSFAFATQIQVGNEILTVEIAKTHETRAEGLMGREYLADGHGMLFIYEKEQRLVFWMKNKRLDKREIIIGKCIIFILFPKLFIGYFNIK